MRSVQARFRFAKVGTDDLREALEQASGRDLEAYFREWVLGTELPSLAFAHREVKSAAGYTTSVQVRTQNLPGPVPIEIAVTHDGGRVTRRFVLPAEGGSLTIESASRPSRVEVNADRGLLAAVSGS
jgi:aminopeptidase N